METVELEGAIEVLALETFRWMIFFLKEFWFMWVPPLAIMVIAVIIKYLLFRSAARDGDAQIFWIWR